MERETSILILGDRSTFLAELGERIRQLGYRSVHAKTPQDAIDLACERRFRFAAGLFEYDFPAVDLDAALSKLRKRADSPSMTFIATGETPPSEERIRLRDAGVELALWSPMSDLALRYQLNSAVASGADDFLRSEARAPIDSCAVVRVGGREKRTQVYCLSPGGAFVESGRPSMSGARVELGLPTPWGEVELPGRVIYTNVPGNLSRPSLPLGMGIRFDDLDPKSLKILRRLVDDRAAELRV